MESTGTKVMQEGKEVHGKKGRGMWKEVRWKRDLKRACSTGFWKKKLETKRKVQRNEVSAGEKGSTKNVKQDTSKTTIVGKEIRRRAKAHKGWGILSHTEAVGRIPAHGVHPLGTLGRFPFKGTCKLIGQLNYSNGVGIIPFYNREKSWKNLLRKSKYRLYLSDMLNA